MCLHPWGMTTGAPPHKQQLHRHPSTTAATPPPTPAAKSSHGYRVVPSYLWAIGIQSMTQNSITNLPNYNSTPVVTELYIYDTYLTNSNLANMHATLKPSMLELSCTRIELSSFAAHLEQPNEVDSATLSTFGQNTATISMPSMTPPSTMLPINLF